MRPIAWPHMRCMINAPAVRAGDAELAGAVIAKCEAAFLDRLRRAQLRLYRRRGERCDTAYDQEHSIGTFQASMCRENLAVLYFRAFSR